MIHMKFLLSLHNNNHHHHFLQFVSTQTNNYAHLLFINVFTRFPSCFIPFANCIEMYNEIIASRVLLLKLSRLQGSRIFARKNGIKSSFNPLDLKERSYNNVFMYTLNGNQLLHAAMHCGAVNCIIGSDGVYLCEILLGSAVKMKFELKNDLKVS